MVAAVEVRVAEPSDAEALGRFLVAAWGDAGPEAPGFAGATDEIIAELAEPDTLRAIIGSDANRIWLAREDGRVVGFAATRQVDAETAELSGIVVARAASGRGVGTELVAGAIDALCADGTTRVFVRTEPDNERAIGFYEARGFTRSHFTTETVGDRELTVIELVMELSSPT